MDRFVQNVEKPLYNLQTLCSHCPKCLKHKQYMLKTFLPVTAATLISDIPPLYPKTNFGPSKNRKKKLPNNIMLSESFWNLCTSKALIYFCVHPISLISSELKMLVCQFYWQLLSSSYREIFLL